MKLSFAMLLPLSWGLLEIACGGSSAKILERVDGATPPGSSPRVDVFLVRSVSTCATGDRCLRDLSQCFTLSDARGVLAAFSTDSLRFVRPGDPLTQTEAQVECFTMVLDDAAVADATRLLTELRARVFEYSGGDINLDIRLHEVPTLDAPFERYLTGLYMGAAALRPMGLPLVSRETDFVFAITGFQDPLTGVTPNMEFCAGSNWIQRGLLGASPYTWLAMSEGCARQAAFFGHWTIQLFVGQTELGNAPNLYPDRDYPACGRGNPDPHRWFPHYNDCTTDPDAPACGQSACGDREAFYAHILSAHWTRGRPYNGNYCADGRMDFDETGVDSGGTCDLIGR